MLGLQLGEPSLPTLWSQALPYLRKSPPSSVSLVGTALPELELPLKKCKFLPRGLHLFPEHGRLFLHLCFSFPQSTLALNLYQTLPCARHRAVHLTHLGAFLVTKIPVSRRCEKREGGFHQAQLGASSLYLLPVLPHTLPRSPGCYGQQAKASSEDQESWGTDHHRLWTVCTQPPVHSIKVAPLLS